jgi:hypothetical protein
VALFPICQESWREWRICIELDAAKKEIELMNGEIEEYKRVINAGDDAIGKLKDYAGELEGLVGTYKKLVADYERLTRPKVALDLGAGYDSTSSPDFPLAALAGLSYDRFRLWFIAKPNGWSLGGGYSIPLW